MAQANGSRFKLVYSHWYTRQGEKFPIANGNPLETVEYIQNYVPEDMEFFIASLLRPIDISQTFQYKNSKYLFRHTLFLQYFLKRFSFDDIIHTSEVVNDGSVYLYPIETELFGYQYLSGKNDYSIHNVLLADQPLINLLRENKVKLFLTNVIDPCLGFSDIDKIKKLVNQLGIPSNALMNMQGSKPAGYVKSSDNVQMFSADLSLHQNADTLINFPITAEIGYISDVVRPDDLDATKKRPFKFLCFNRSMNRSHRLAICYIAIKFDLIRQGYFSFLNYLPENITDYLFELYYDDEMFEIEKKIREIVPLQIDTKHLSDKERESFATIDCNFKDYYAETYVHITSETVFDNNEDQFFSEKTWRPIMNLQPFIYVGNYRALEKLKRLGFKTFHPYIDESYDLVQDPKLRFLLIIQEIKKIASKPLNEIHVWYYSITDILIHNQTHLSTFKNYNPFDPFFDQNL
jgi:hypothetical protein